MCFSQGRRSQETRGTQMRKARIHSVNSHNSQAVDLPRIRVHAFMFVSASAGGQTGPALRSLFLDRCFKTILVYVDFSLPPKESALTLHL